MLRKLAGGCFVTLSLLALSACKPPVPHLGPAPVQPKSATSGCHYRPVGADPLLVLPDAHCTPGARNPAVTQATIRSTICRAGYTATIRPSVQESAAIKTKAIAAYGLPASVRASTELDHLLPLELGGAASDPANLWPEPNYRDGPHPTSYDHNPKDPQETALRKAVCSGRLTLAAVQAAVLADWVTAPAKLGMR